MPTKSSCATGRRKSRAAALAPIAAVLALGACADTGTRVLPAYTLANGAVLQDVVSMAADPSGGAPVITTLTTYDVGTPGETEMVSRETSSSPGPGLPIASGVGSALPTTAAVVGLSLARGGDDEETIVNTSSFSTSGNTAVGGGDAGDIDAVSAAFDCGADCSISN